MKALMTKNAKKILADSLGKDQIKKFIRSGSKSAQIKISDGQVFTIKSERG